MDGSEPTLLPSRRKPRQSGYSQASPPSLGSSEFFLGEFFVKKAIEPADIETRNEIVFLSTTIGSSL
ncbi:hypothetical protein KC318_g18 [Hortaea werneckii]|nr:hypothetical protein KC334_g17 [Hortaea werneckii]KAI7028346.1 hypothetical protein KC355_g19 [Hortaea werneckii]KAI7676788.1 hypothetical protein KC318_g18 [Hortaea werneckii]